jgi:uncharacterized OB-fold protein
MTEDAAATKPRAVVSFLKIPDQGDPYLEGHRCKSCGAVYLGARRMCSRCGARDQIEAIRLADQGELHVFTVVHRSFPGIRTPYVSAVVDLEGGGTVKGNLINIDPDPEKIRMGMPVRVVYQIAPMKDQEGNEYLTYYFEPRA